MPVPPKVAGSASPGPHPGRGRERPGQSRIPPAAAASSGSIKGLALGDVGTFHDSLQVPGRADDERGMDMIVAEEVPYLTAGGGPRMSCGSRVHRLGGGRKTLSTGPG